MTKENELPLIIVSIDQGVPFANKKYSFILHGNSLSYFKTKQLQDGDCFYLTLSTDENFALDLTEFANALSFTGPIGFKCKITSKESAKYEDNKDEELEEITCYVEKEVYLNKVTSFENKITAIGSDIQYEPIIEEQHLLKELISFLYFVCSKIGDFPKDKLEEIEKSTSTKSLCDTIVDIYFKDNFEKYIYIQTTEEQEKVKMVLNYLLESNENFINLSLGDFALLSKIRNRAKEELEIKSSSDEKKPKRNFPSHVKKVLSKELKKLQRTPSSSLEAQSIQSYIETIRDIPWEFFAELNAPLSSMAEEINKTHSGLENVKQHVMEHLVLESHLSSPIGSVLCFIGPPGTGKTSIAKSIAKATNREVIKLALGGVTDEAEIRGHRRTYVAAKQGRLIDGLIKAKQMNPIIILDEVDKLDKGVRGDPTSALLELLDPEQNSEFVDRYIEVPIDLSKVLFICTANYEENIPEPLKDRLEMIYFEKYSFKERLKIVKDYIYPNLLEKYEMKNFKIETLPNFFEIISKEDSLRKIEKNVSKILKVVLSKFILDKINSYILDEKAIDLLMKTKQNKQKIGFK